MKSVPAPLAGKVAIVTGGGRGIGRAMVRGLVQAGASVVATAAREAAEIEAVAAAGGERILPFMADVTRADVCERVVDATLQRFGGNYMVDKAA